MDMPGEPLSKTNPFLKDPEERLFRLYTSVASSTAIEGIRVPFLNGRTEREILDFKVKFVYAGSSGPRRRE